MSEPRLSVGIDLGTTFSALAYLDSSGRPTTVVGEDGELTTPSAVLLEQGNVVVGREALKAAVHVPGSVARFMKRELGRPQGRVSVGGVSLPPEVLQAAILHSLAKTAKEKLGSFEDVVIAVPAYFNEPRRVSTMDAGRIAGLNVIDIINEPTAAALSLGLSQGFLSREGQTRAPRNVLVYDLGGGTFDVTIMRIEGNHYAVLATDGDVKLGGIDWDQCVASHIASVFEKTHNMDPREDPAVRHRMLLEAEETKRALSARDETTMTLEWKGCSIRERLSRDEFESMTAHLLERTRFTVNSVMNRASLKWSDISRVLVTGGSSRMPAVGEMLSQESGKPVDRSLSADESVAHGAAIHAGLLSNDSSIAQHNMTVTNVSSHSLGVLGTDSKTNRKRNRILIPVDTALPVEQTAEFTTGSTGQRSVLVKVIEGGDASGNDSTLIGSCVIRDLPANVPAGTPVRVTFRYLTNGSLDVEAALTTLETRVQVVIERAHGLSKEEVAEWKTRLQENTLLAIEPTAAPDDGDIDRLGTNEQPPRDSTPSDSPTPVPDDVPPPVPDDSPPPVPSSAPPPVPTRVKKTRDDREPPAIPASRPRKNRTPPPLPD